MGGGIDRWKAKKQKVEGRWMEDRWMDITDLPLRNNCPLETQDLFRPRENQL